MAASEESLKTLIGPDAVARVYIHKNTQHLCSNSWAGYQFVSRLNMKCWLLTLKPYRLESLGKAHLISLWTCLAFEIF